MTYIYVRSTSRNTVEDSGANGLQKGLILIGIVNYALFSYNLNFLKR